MNFQDVLKRYHISPLKYEDNVLLNEKDYKDLYKMLTRYFVIKGVSWNFLIQETNDLQKKVERIFNNTLIPFTEEEMMDILTDQYEEAVL